MLTIKLPNLAAQWLLSHMRNTDFTAPEATIVEAQVALAIEAASKSHNPHGSFGEGLTAATDAEASQALIDGANS